MKSKFVSYIPNPFDSWHKFEKNDAMEDVVSLILGDNKEGQSVLFKWYQYFENHLILPIEVMVECPIKKVANNTTSTTQIKMSLVSLAPLERCSLPFILCIARVGQADAGRFVFADHIRKFLDNKDAEQVFMPYIYWLYFQKMQS